MTSTSAVSAQPHRRGRTTRGRLGAITAALAVLASPASASALGQPWVGASTNVTNESHTQNEPMVAIHPRDHRRLVVGYNDYRAGDGGSRLSWSWSDDGGAGWTYGGTLAVPGYNRGGDPVVAFDAAGTAYLAGLAWVYDGTSATRGTIVVARSDDGGHTFAAHQTIVAAGVGTSPYHDKPWLFVNPANGHVYVSWTERTSSDTRFRILFARSVDQGATFSAPIQVGADLDSTTYPKSFGSQISAGAGDTLYVSWHTTEKGTNPNLADWQPPRIWIAESPDDGLTFGASHLVATKQHSFPNRFISMATHPPSGTTFITYVEREAYPGDNDVYVATGTSAAGPWTIRKVNTTTNENIWSTLSVAPNGRVDVIWYGVPDTGGLATYYTSSGDLGATWEPSTRISSLYTSATGFAGDYITVAAADEKAVAVWMQNAGNQEIFHANVVRNDAAWARTTLDLAGGEGASLALDSAGTPHVAHARGYFQSPPHELKYTTWDLSGAPVTEVLSSGLPVSVQSLALDASDVPHFIYDEFASDAPDSTRRLMYARREAGSWILEPVGTPGAGGQNPSLSDLALDSAGNPHVSYMHDATGTLTYAHRSGGTWTHEALDVGVLASWTSIALSPSGAPLIAYAVHGPNLTQYLKLATRGTGGWTYETIDPGGPGMRVGSVSSLALDAGGNPHVTYWDSVDNDLRYAVRIGGAWRVSTLDGAGAVGRWSSLAIDSGGLPHVAYYGNRTLKYASQDASGAWFIDVRDAESALNVGLDVSLALDAGDRPHVAYLAGVQQQLRYAYAAARGVQSATGAGPIQVSSNTGRVASASGVPESTLPTAGKPAGVTFPFGFVSWKVTGLAPGASATITLRFPSNVPSPAQYWKVIGGVWTNASALLGDDDGDNVLTLTVTDGGFGDADGAVNGEITDPGAVGLDPDPPVVTVPAAVTAEATRADGALVSFVATALDVAAGPLTPTCTPASGSLFPPGTTTVTCTATDPSGNVGAASFPVTVAFTWSGLLPPIDPGGAMVFKLGRTVPVKFRLGGASGGITDLVATVLLAKVTDGILGSEEGATSTSAADSGNRFRFDAAEGTYVFNLATAELTRGTWQLRVELGDGVSRTAQFSLRP